MTGLDGEREQFSLLLKEFAKSKGPSGRSWERRLSWEVFDDVRVWFRQASVESAIWAFTRAVKRKVFDPLELWFLMMELYERVDRKHLPALEQIHAVMAGLRDEVPTGTRVSFVDVLLDFEFVLYRRGMPLRRIEELRGRNWGHYADVMETLRRPIGSGSWHVEIPSGLPGLGKRR